MTKIRVRASSSQDIKSLLPEIVAAVQAVYTAWEQDEEGMDEELGAGGVCQDIAEAICSVLAEKGIECSTVSAQVGEQHVYTIAQLSDGVFAIDIPPSVYESGGGYTWKKLKDVVFKPSDIYLDKISDDPEDFENYLED
jgi:hypothetical protein